MRKVLASLLAVGVLVAGGLAFALVQDSSSAGAQESTTEEEAPLEGVEGPNRQEIIDGVWDDLIADGVVTAEQAEQIQAAFEAKKEELREQFGDFRGRRGFGHNFGELRDMLEDGVIDADELASLGEDHPLNNPDGPFADAAADGEITQEELEELRASFGPRGARGFGQGNGNAAESGFSA